MRNLGKYDFLFSSNIYFFSDLCLNTCVKNWAIVMKTTDHAKGVLQNLPPLLHYRFMTLCATLWILLLFWFLRVWGIDCSCKRLYLAMQATHVCCWAFRQKGLTLELRGYLHGRERQQRAKEIRATQHLQRLWIMLAHPALKREDRLGKEPFAGFGTVVEDITESGYTKNQPILLGFFWENAFFVFLHYKINGSKGVFWP